MSSHEQGIASADPEFSKLHKQRGTKFRSVVRCSTCKKHRQRCTTLPSKSSKRSKSNELLACTMCTAKSLEKSCDIIEMIVRAHDKQSQSKRKNRQQDVQLSEEAEKDIEGDISTQSKIDDYFDWISLERSRSRGADDVWNTRLPPLEGGPLTAFSQLNAADHRSNAVAPFRHLVSKSPAASPQLALPVPYSDAHMAEDQENSLNSRDNQPEYRGTIEAHPMSPVQHANNGVFNPAEVSAVFSQPEWTGINATGAFVASLNGNTELIPNLTWDDLLIEENEIPVSSPK